MRQPARAILLLLATGLLALAGVPSRSHAVEIIGHRGASHDAPENTLASINLAWKQRADASETDVHLTKDGEVVVIHDFNTRRVGGRNRKVVEQTLAELKELDIGRWKGPQLPANGSRRWPNIWLPFRIASGCLSKSNADRRSSRDLRK
jgi:glycerophosphoryl diester phosphodiesterase